MAPMINEQDEIDTAARAAALDVTRSFLVHAPAGSGKTELLIQRYLALLASVEQPERIVAMTFTRKAAAEMRDRVVEALRSAGDATASDAHKRKTLTLARAALERDRALGWDLIDHPAQLRIYTIDALCAAINRQAPITTRFGASPRIEDPSAPLYRRAVQTALIEADAADPSWQTLLAHNS